MNGQSCYLRRKTIELNAEQTVYLASVWESSQPKPLQKSSPLSPASGVYAIRAVQSTCTMTMPLRQWKHTRKFLLSSAMTMGSTSCKPSQDVSKKSREQIQTNTISTTPREELFSPRLLPLRHRFCSPQFHSRPTICLAGSFNIRPSQQVDHHVHVPQHTRWRTNVSYYEKLRQQFFSSVWEY